MAVRSPYFFPLKRMTAAEFPCALCKQFLHDYLDYSLRVRFRKREAAAKALHPIFLRDLLADIGALFAANDFMDYRLSRSRAIQKRKGVNDALHFFYKTDVRLRATLDLWVILCSEAGLATLELIEPWVSHTLYEVFTIIKDYHKGHMPHLPSSPTEEVVEDYLDLEPLEDLPSFTR